MKLKEQVNRRELEVSMIVQSHTRGSLYDVEHAMVGLLECRPLTIIKTLLV